MGARIDVESLTMGDVSVETWGTFTKPENLDRYLNTYAGEAQVEVMTREMKEQMVAQGVEDYDPSIEKIRRVLFSEQASQSFGGEPDVTNRELLDMTETKVEWLGRLVGAFDEVADPNAIREDVILDAQSDDAEVKQTGTGYFGTETPTDRFMREQDGGSALKM